MNRTKRADANMLRARAEFVLKSELMRLIEQQQLPSNTTTTAATTTMPQLPSFYRRHFTIRTHRRETVQAKL